MERFPQVPLETPAVREECQEEVPEWDLIVAAGFNPVDDEDLEVVPDHHGNVDCPCCEGTSEHEYLDRLFRCVACKGKGAFRVA